MTHFPRIAGQLHAEQVSLTTIGQRYGTPCYIYSRQAIESAWHELDQALEPHPHQICYAVKANSNLAVLNLMVRMGSGFDVVSGGELERVLAAGGDPAKVVFSGVGKTNAELQLALSSGVGCINLESVTEIGRLEKVAKDLGLVAPVALRVNPDVDALTHPYISTGLKENKFGVDINGAVAIYQRIAASKHLSATGIDCHIGSQLTQLDPLVDAVERLLRVVDELAGQSINLDHIDVGGGLGIRYQDEQPPTMSDYANLLLKLFAGRSEHIYVEPGRSMVGNSGVLLTQVLGLKPGDEKNFALVDAAMNDLLRPTLYGAWHDIQPVSESTENSRSWDVVGPICETGDFLGQNRQLAIAEDDLLAVMSCGAYGFTMASNYNSRPKAAEVMVDGSHHQLIRKREQVSQLFADESLLAD